MSDRLRWDVVAARWLPLDDLPAGGSVEVADSWLLDNGRVRRFDLHWQRFAASAAEVGADADRLEQARAALAAVLPSAGRWFPRLDLCSSGNLDLTLRPAPAPESEVIAWLYPEPDPRALPRRKGPELELLGQLREQAERHGAGEAVLTDRSGRLLEGAYSSLLWWEGETLCALPDEAAVLPGVTRRLLLEIAAEDEVEIGYRWPTLAELEGRELWLVSALHGVRAVSGWAEDGPSPGAALRAPAWQQRLLALAS